LLYFQYKKSENIFIPLPIAIVAQKFSSLNHKRKKKEKTFSGVNCLIGKHNSIFFFLTTPYTFFTQYNQENKKKIELMICFLKERWKNNDSRKG
jgi:hypothetical protein